jgi:hypothetical protein
LVAAVVAADEDLSLLFSAIITFEIGGDFCNCTCTVRCEVFERAMDLAWASVNN